DVLARRQGAGGDRPDPRPFQGVRLQIDPARRRETREGRLGDIPMTTPAPNDLLSRLRAADELYAQVEPAPAAEARLCVRLRGLAGKPQRSFRLPSLRQIRRPLVLV